jgi:uncharacterized glyoxalase superfamily protein PhnB
MRAQYVTMEVMHGDEAVRVWRAHAGGGAAVEAGAAVGHELGDTFWGERHGQLTDPFGHRWNLAQRVRDVPQDEIVAAAAHAFGG